MEDLEVGYGVTIPAAELAVKFTRARGPGGQNVNKRSTRAELTFNLVESAAVPSALKRRARGRLRSKLEADGTLRIAAEDERTQRANREAARDRMRATLRAAFKPPPPKRRKTKPSRGARERRLSEKKRRGELKRRRRGPIDE